jgi:UTP--glucose-1-phosphate uridylyltransferase
MGTRFLPATRAVAKELLPVVDRPLIQYAVHEAVQAGATTIVFVVSPGKQSILEHFQPDPALEHGLRNKPELLRGVRAILPPGVRVLEALQEQPLGLGHAVLCAREQVGDDAFFQVLLPDDMLRNPGGPGAMAQLLAAHQRSGASVLGVERVDPSLTGSYGIVEVETQPGGQQRIVSMVEKPAPEDAPSDLGVVGRYLLDSRIFAHLETLGAGAGGEIQLTDAISALLAEQAVYAQPLQGTRYDCGNRLGMLKANIDFALDDPELGPAVQAHMRTRLAQAN